MLVFFLGRFLSVVIAFGRVSEEEFVLHLYFSNYANILQVQRQKKPRICRRKIVFKHFCSCFNIKTFFFHTRPALAWKQNWCLFIYSLNRTKTFDLFLRTSCWILRALVRIMTLKMWIKHDRLRRHMNTKSIFFKA